MSRFHLQLHHKRITLLSPLLLGAAVMILIGPVPVRGQLSVPGGGNDARPELEMKAVPSKVYKGESFQLAITLKNASSETPPDMDYLRGEFDLEFLGLRPRNSSIQITINNVTRVREEKGVTFFYKLTPKNDGTIRIISPNVSVDGLSVTASPVTIEVIPPGDQDLVRLEMTSNTPSVYPLTPFDVTLSVYVKALPGKFSDEDPILAISRQVAVPSLEIAWGKDEGLPSGVVPSKDWQRWVTSYQSGEKGGFSINHLRFEDPFDFGWAFGDSKRNEATFYSPPKKVELSDKDGKTSTYWRYDFTRTFTSEKTGDADFDAAVLKGRFVVSDEEGKLAPEEVYVISKPLTISVKDVPETDRPADYVGAFGRFDLGVELNPKTPKVGEAMTLTVTLQGKGSVLNVKAPNLEENRALSGRYRVYPPSEETEDGRVRWTWSLRPLREGSLPFPSLGVSYFDIASEKFVTLKSDEIPITVEKSAAANSASDSGVPFASAPTGSKETAMKRSAEGIFENMIRPPRGGGDLTLKDWTIMSASLYLASFLIWGTAGLWRRKSHSAKTLLTRQIQEGRKILAEGWNEADLRRREDVSNQCRRVLRAFLIPAAGWFSAKIDAVSRSQIDAVLDEIASRRKEGTSDRKTIDDVKGLAARLERIQYGFEEALPKMKKETVELYERWGILLAKLGTNPPRREKESATVQNERSRKTPPTFGVLIALVCGLTVLIGCSRRLDSESARQFDEAIRLFDEADATRPTSPSPTPDVSDGAEPFDPKNGSAQEAFSHSEAEALSSDTVSAAESFKKVAALYEGLLRRGIETGPILYNQGNAFMRAKDAPNALASWRRAEKYLPGNPYLAANIATLKPNDSAGKKSLIETILFWQDSLSWGAKGTITLLFAFLSCVGFLVLSIGHPSKRVFTQVKRVTILCSLLFVLFFASLYYDHCRFDLGDHGIIATEEGIVRKGGSAQYAPLFRDPLPKLTECRVLEKRSGWLRVRFHNGQSGWLPESDVLVY